MKRHATHRSTQGYLHGRVPSRNPEKKQAGKQRYRDRQSQKRQSQERESQENRKIQKEPAHRRLLRLLSDRPITEIAQAMNVSRATVYRWLRELQWDAPGFNRPRVPMKRTQESQQRDDEIQAMYQTGRSQNQIAAIYGITRQPSTTGSTASKARSGAGRRPTATDRSDRRPRGEESRRLCQQESP